MAYDVTGQQKSCCAAARGLFFDRPSGNCDLRGGATRRRSSIVTVALRAAAESRQRRPDDRRARRRSTRFEYDQQAAVVHAVERRRADAAAVGDRRLTSSTSASTATTRSHGQHQCGRLRRGVPAAEPGPDAGGEHDAGRDARCQTDLLRAYPGLRRRSTAVGARLAHVSLDSVVVPAPVPATACRSASTTPSGSPTGRTPARVSSTRGRLLRVSRRSGRGRRTARQQRSRRRTCCKANFVWDLPDLRERRRPCCGRSASCSTTGSCPASGPAATGGAYTVGFSYQNGGGNVNLTGSPDYGARVRIVGDPGSGCSERRLPAVQYGGVPGAARTTASASSRATTTCAAASRACSTWPSPGTSGWAAAANIQLRVDMFNAPNAGRHHRPQHDDEPDEPDRSGDDHQPAVRCGRQLIAPGRCRAARDLASRTGTRRRGRSSSRCAFRFRTRARRE